MPRREGKVLRPEDQQFHGPASDAGPQARRQRFEKAVAQQDLQREGQKHGQAGSARPSEEGQAKSDHDPDQAGVPQTGNADHERVQDAAAQMGLDKI